MVNPTQFDDITEKIDKHFEKTGVVLVGMHQELQEQKHRISQYHDKVDAVTSDLNRRRDEIVAELRTRAEAAVAVLDEIDPVVQRVRSVAQDADDAVKSAGEALKTSTNNLSRSHNDFRAEAEDLIGSIEKRIESFSSETIVLLKKFSEQQDQSITASSKENHLALQAVVGEQAKFLGSAESIFRESITKLEERVSAHMDAHKRFLKSSYDELSERQRAGDAAFSALKVESERHQAQQIEFAKKTRLIIVGLLVAGFAVVGILAYARGGLL
jgi:hypothetical protein